MLLKCGCLSIFYSKTSPFQLVCAHCYSVLIPNSSKMVIRINLVIKFGKYELGATHKLSHEAGS